MLISISYAISSPAPLILTHDAWIGGWIPRKRVFGTMSAKILTAACILAAAFLSVAAVASMGARAGNIPSATVEGKIGVGAGFANETIRTAPVQEAAQMQNASAETTELARRSSSEDWAKQGVEALLASMLALVAMGPIYGAARVYAVARPQ